MLYDQQEIKFHATERINLELTPLARQWLYDDAALKNKAEASAREYLKYLDGLLIGERVDLCREARGETHKIAARVTGNTMTKVVVAIDEDTLLPGGVRYERGEVVVVSKNIDILLSGARRLAPVDGK